MVFSFEPNQSILGKLEISDQGLTYDNTLYFNISKAPKIKVLGISEADANFLSRIYTEDEFVFQNYRLSNLEYNKIEDQNLIVLNELSVIPQSLINALKAFYMDGGSILIIPNGSFNLQSYNALCSALNHPGYNSVNENQLKLMKTN